MLTTLVGKIPSGPAAARPRPPSSGSRAIVRLRREKAQVSVAAVARRADVSGTFLYGNSEARSAISKAMAARSNLRCQGRRLADLEAWFAEPGPAT